MGKPTGFLEIERKVAHYRPIKQRLKDYKDVSEYLSDEEIMEQASRCMDCGVPFCHCVGCPASNLIPEWNDLVSKGKCEEAFRRIEKTNPLPELTGRVCPATCESSCTLSINNAPVTIKQIELAVIEKAFKNGWVKPRLPKQALKKKVAVIGSGPSGLASAIVLREKGFDVTVFERSNKIGGILRFGIPDFKLEKWVLDRRVAMMKATGIKFKTNAKVGDKLSAKSLKKSFDAVLLTVGAGEPRDLKIPGRELEGVYFAMEYLTQSNKYVCGDLKKSDIINAKNKNVLVIGGGDTGSDCVGTANRQGARKVSQFEIMPKPREWAESRNPVWPEWPIILRTSSSHEEGVSRDWSINTKEFVGEKGKLKKVHCVRVEWKASAPGQRPSPVEVKGSDFHLDAELVLLAMGFVHVEHSKLLKDLGVETDERGNIKTDGKYKTTAKNVYAAGDADIGASLVVRAICQGRNAATVVYEAFSKK